MAGLAVNLAVVAFPDILVMVAAYHDQIEEDLVVLAVGHHEDLAVLAVGHHEDLADLAVDHLEDLVEGPLEDRLVVLVVAMVVVRVVVVQAEVAVHLDVRTVSLMVAFHKDFEGQVR